MKRLCILFILLITALLSAQQLYINEFMADNDNIIADEQGDFDDWLEIYNPNSVAVDLGGYFLSDTADELDQYEVPTDDPDQTTIPAGGFLIIWCDDDDNDGPLHTNFKLSAGGEALFLTEWNGVDINDSYEFGEQTTDVSEGRVTDGADQWQFFTAPTPGSSNGGVNQPPMITNWQQLQISPEAGESVDIIALVTDDNDDLDEVIINYNTGSGWQEAFMYDDGSHNDGSAGDDLYGGTIPGFAQATMVSYYLEAIDEDEAAGVFPVNAPEVLLEYENGWQHPQILINEFMAANDTTITDPEGDYEDWIEIYNAGDAPVDIAGYWFTDEYDNLSSWFQIPATSPDSTTIAPGEFLLLWADEDTEDGICHLDFKLSSDGENFGFYAYFATTPVDSLSYLPLDNDVSWGRLPDGSENWQAFGIGMEHPATPGYSNQPSANETDQITFCQSKISKIYPNPFSYQDQRANLAVELMVSNSELIELAVYDIRGRKISAQSFPNLKPGNNTVNFSLPDRLAAGVYFMKNIGVGNSSPQKLIIVK